LGSVMSGAQPLRAPRSCRGALLLRVGQAPDSVLVFFTPRAFGNAAGALHLSHAPPGPPEHRRDLQWPRASEDDLRHVDRANPDPHAAGMRPLQACKPKTGSRQTRTTVTLLRSASTSHTTSALNKRRSREGLGQVSASYSFFNLRKIGSSKHRSLLPVAAPALLLLLPPSPTSAPLSPLALRDGVRVRSTIARGACSPSLSFVGPGVRDDCGTWQSVSVCVCV